MNLHIKEKVKKLLINFFKIGHISIYIDSDYFLVFVTIIKNGRVIHSESRKFDCLEDNQAPSVMKDFFKSFYDRVKYAYVSTYIDTINQGAVQGCSDEIFHKLGLDMQSLVKFCIKEKWFVYTNIYEIDKIQEKYKTIYGVDFIFPMESMIEYKKPKDKSKEATLYILNNTNSATLTVYKDNELLYSSHFLFDDKDDSLIAPDDLGDDGSELAEGEELDEELDGLDMDDEESLDDLDDMDNLDDIDDLDDFVVEGDDDIDEDDGSDEIQSEQDLKKELLLFDFVDNSLKDYYKNPDYNSDFITEAFIFDSCKCSVGLKKHIKEVFFVEPKILSLDLGETMCELSQLEAELHEPV